MELLKEATNFQPVCFIHVPEPAVTPQVITGNPFYCRAVQSPSLDAGMRSPQNCRVSTSESNNNTTNEIVQENVPKNEHLDNDKKMEIAPVEGATTNYKLETDRTNAESNHNDTNIDRPFLEGDSATSQSTIVSSPSHRMGKVFITSIPPVICTTIFNELCKVGYLTDTPGVRNISRNMVEDYFEVDSILVTDFDKFLQSFTGFSEQTMQRYLVNAVTVLNNTHIRCLNTFIICAFDMAREVLITPKKIEFARDKEEGLFKSLMTIAIEKGDEIKDMIESTILDSKSKLLDKAFEYDFIGELKNLDKNLLN